MKTDLACLPCFFRQMERTLSYAGINGDRGRGIMRKGAEIIESASLDLAPARITTLLHRLMREETAADPYKAIKDDYNRIALGYLPEVRRMAARPDIDPLSGGVRAAIAGNVIDFGIYDRVDLDKSLAESFILPLADESLRDFSLAVRQAGRILYLCDNAGEIVFDRILIDYLRTMGKTVIAAVKGTPVINDATMDDAAAVRLGESATRVIDNGNDGIGTLLELCSEPFLEAYRAADLIISKGQANFETLSPVRDSRIFFLFKVKCRVVADSLGRSEGDIVIMRNGQKSRECGAGKSGEEIGEERPPGTPRPQFRT